MRRTVGLTPLVPSIDPASLVFNAASILGPLIRSFIGTGHLEANQITPVQNKYHHEVLEPAVAAKDDPSTSLDDLIYWRDLVATEGEAFYQFTQKFPQAGAGARRTIFGEQDAAGNWITTSNALGIATQILRGFNSVIYQRTGDVNSQLGIDWGRLIQTGVQIAAGITGQPVIVSGGGQVITSVPPSQRPGYIPPASGIPSWLLPVGIGVLALAFLAPRRSR
jgi:hypothetical protein